MASAPASLVRLASKGAIRAGADADLVVFDADERWTVSGQELFHRHKLTPYDKMELAGHVRATYLRGQKVFESGRMVGPPTGRTMLAGR
jgi:allantoinase